MLLVDRELVERVRGAQAGTELLGVVQSAVELEHATIPPYLTAYYTLRPGRNDESGCDGYGGGLVVSDLLSGCLGCHSSRPA